MDFEKDLSAVHAMFVMDSSLGRHLRNRRCSGDDFLHDVADDRRVDSAETH
jgi:hypothetical protein